MRFFHPQQFISFQFFFPLFLFKKEAGFGAEPQKILSFSPELVGGHAYFLAEGGIEGVDRAVTDGAGDCGYRVV